MVARISVDGGRMKSGHPNCIRVEVNGQLRYAAEAHVGEGKFVTSSVPTSYGATIWFETEHPVVMCLAPQEGEES